MKERLKMVRESRGLSQTKFAESLGLTVAAVSYYESGKRIPTNAVLTLISQKYGVSFAWLKTGEGPMNDPTPDLDIQQKLAETYHNLPDRLRSLVDALIQMDPEWYKTLDRAFDAIEKRRNSGDAD